NSNRSSARLIWPHGRRASRGPRSGRAAQTRLSQREGFARGSAGLRSPAWEGVQVGNGAFCLFDFWFSPPTPPERTKVGRNSSMWLEGCSRSIPSSSCGPAAAWLRSHELSVYYIIEPEDDHGQVRTECVVPGGLDTRHWPQPHVENDPRRERGAVSQAGRQRRRALQCVPAPFRTTVDGQTQRRYGRVRLSRHDLRRKREVRPHTGAKDHSR